MSIDSAKKRHYVFDIPHKMASIDFIVDIGYGSQLRTSKLQYTLFTSAGRSFSIFNLCASIHHTDECTPLQWEVWSILCRKKYAACAQYKFHGHRSLCLALSLAS